MPAARLPDEALPDDSSDESLASQTAASQTADSATVIERRPTGGVVLAAIAIFATCGVLLMLLIRSADYWEPVWARKHVSTSVTKAPVTERNAPADKPDFENSYERLNRALSAFPGANTGDVIQAARKAVPETAKWCAVRWQGGDAALQYGKDGGTAALAVAIGHCAEAVEGLASRLAEAQAKNRRESGY
jgi:hypothetical protein